ncbi:sensor histidine kinase [Peribacillus alkalitolerans]|uniref:sensor histidine kinase n=1 Tax=Peribacillus alkalitolerans TaxID=1550385 RepID=UPI0013D2BBDE|nr:HAMP domain-containing sensor histidine kinase [Peribacillus alkalitolerans]
MSIRLRMLLSYTAMLVVTIGLFIISGLLMIVAITGDISSIKHLYANHYTHKPITAQEENVFLDLKYLAINQPDQLLDKNSLKLYDKKLKDVSSALIIRKGDAFIYKNNKLISIRNPDDLPRFEPSNINIRSTISIGKYYFSYVKFDFYFEDHEIGSIFVIKKVSPYVALSKNLFPILICVLLILLIVTNGILNYLVTRSIVNPLHSLKLATEKIRDGDLNFKVTPGTRDEIGQLTMAYEEMRQRLKDSIDLQLKYEENRKELISNISHDLRTPITAIKGYVEGIKDGVADTPQKMDKYLSTIYRRAIDMDSLIDDLFLFSKLDLKKIQFNFEEIDIIRYINYFIEELSWDFEEKGIDVQFHVDLDNPVLVIADREKLKRVFVNIIQNSIKHMKKDEKIIQFSVVNKGKNIEIEISDNGNGIEPSSLSYIFERFYREDNARNTSTGGSGLGLAIAKQIITEHGGEIRVTSEIGRGTSIFFTLKFSEKSEVS